MKVFLILSLAVIAASAEKQKVRPQTRQSPFTYPAGSTAAYPPQTGLIYNANTKVKYVAGITVYYPYGPVTVKFADDSQFYVREGPVSVVANTSVTYGAGTQVTFPPGTNVEYLTNNAEVKHLQFNGNSHGIVQYPYQTNARYYYSDPNLILYQPGTNPLIYYNPGGTTRFGVSGLPVETEPPQTRTYGGYYGGGCGYSYCSGYSYGGYPQTTYYNSNTGYRSTCSQTGPSSYSYGGGGGGYGGASVGSGMGGGGYSMAGGSCYGGGAYYGSYGGGGYYGK